MMQKPKLPAHWHEGWTGLDRIRFIFTELERFSFERLPGAKDSLNIPDFLCVGNPQSGTSWLHKMLERDQRIGLTTPKETKYFDQKFHRSIRYYSNLFKSENCLYRGEVNPGYAPLKLKRIRYIHKLNPNMKIFFILRNPIERSWSHCNRRFPNKRPGIDELNWVLDPNIRNRGSCHIPGYRWSTSDNYMRWRTCFPEEQVKIFLFEDIRKDPLDLLERIYSFLGIEGPLPELPDATTPINQNPKSSIPKDCSERLVLRFKDEIAEISNLLQLDLSHWLEAYED